MLVENGAELHQLAKMMTNKLNLLLYGDDRLINDHLLPNLEGMVDFRRQSPRSDDRIKTDLDAARGLVFLCFLC